MKSFVIVGECCNLGDQALSIGRPCSSKGHGLPLTSTYSVTSNALEGVGTAAI